MITAGAMILLAGCSGSDEPRDVPLPDEGRLEQVLATSEGGSHSSALPPHSARVYRAPGRG